MKRSDKTRQPNVLIIGIDGATFDLIKPWAEEGKLPTFMRLLNEGVHGDLESVIPPITPPAWTSFMTGMNPGKHGLFNFIEHSPQDQSIRYTNASNRKAHTIWKLLSDIGWRVGVINLPMTYPPEEVNGFCISGLDTPDEDSNFVYPAWIKKELEQAVGKVYLDPRHLGYMKTDDKRDHILNALIEIEERRTEIAEYLIKNHPVDVMMLVYTAVDTVQHFFWNYMDHTYPLHDPAGADRYRDAILNIYRMIDSNIAKLLRSVPEDCAVILVSDHGGRAVSRKVIHLNQYLEELGLLVYKNGRNGIPSRLLNRLTRGLDGYLRSVLSPGQKTRLARMFPYLREKWETYSNALAMIDWEKTQAYCLEFLSFPSEIWINLEGQMPHGRVKPGAEHEDLIEFLTCKLYDLKDDETGKRLIQRVYRKEEVYKGPYLHLAPDLILSWWGEPGFQIRKSVPGASPPIIRDCTHTENVLSASWNGTHSLHGILLMKGGPFRKGEVCSKAHITDIAPTLFYLLGIPVPVEMDGQVLLDAFQEGHVSSHPIQYHPDSLSMHSGNSAGVAYTAVESEEIRERLKGLGYIDS